MPIIRTTILKGFTTPEQQEQIITALADTLVDVMGEVTKPYISSILEEVNPSTWSFAGTVLTEEMIAMGHAASVEYAAKKLTEQRVADAYAALGSGDPDEVDRLWDRDMVWLVPGESRVSGLKKGRDEFFKFMQLVGELSGNSFNMEPQGVFLAGDRSIDLSRNTGTRAGDSGRKLDISVAHIMRWSDEGRIVEGRGAIFGGGTTEFNEFWA